MCRNALALEVAQALIARSDVVLQSMRPGVADRLGIPHYVIDAEARFRAAVMQDFADSYAAGQTPVPCVRCNQKVKFADLLDTARELGAEAMATGHYVRRVEGAAGAELHAAADPVRDQSYFLFATTQAQLDYLRFPLGDMDKREVRAIAAELGLVNAAKPDSQDICFVPSGHYSDIVDRVRPDAARAGDIVDQAGKVLGRHDGFDPANEQRSAKSCCTIRS
jgi:tRNA-specific 2-thiouridylase